MLTGREVGKRESNRLRVRQDLGFAAVRLFDARGYDETTVDDIVAEAGVSRRTFFRHFPSKADVLFYDHQERLEAMEEALAEVPAERSALTALSDLTEMVLPTFLEPADFFMARHRVLRANEALRRREQALGLAYTRALSRFLASRLESHPRGELLADLVAGATVTVVNRAQYEWAASGGEVDPVAATRAGMALVDEIFGRFVEPDRLAAAGQPTLLVISQDGTIHPEVLERLGRALSE